MDFSALRYDQEQLRDAIKLTATIWGKDAPSFALQWPTFCTIEEKCQAVCGIITQDCREITKIQVLPEKILHDDIRCWRLPVMRL